MIYHGFDGKKISYLGVSACDAETVHGAAAHGVNLFEIPDGAESIADGAPFPDDRVLLLHLPAGEKPADAFKRIFAFTDRADLLVIDSSDGYGEDDYGEIMSRLDSGDIDSLGLKADSLESAKRTVDFFGGALSFACLGVNWLCWETGAAERVKYLMDKGLAIIASDPMAGGRLSSLDKTASEELSALRPDESIRSWAFRFLQSVPCINAVICPDWDSVYGDTASTHEPLSPAERAALFRIARRT